MIKNCKIFFLVVLFGPVSLINSGFSDVSNLFINAPAALAASALAFGRWYFNSVHIDEMKKLRSDLAVSNQNLVETGGYHRLTTQKMALIGANQVAQNEQMVRHQKMLGIVQKKQDKVGTLQEQILQRFIPIEASLAGAIKNLDDTRVAHESASIAQAETNAILERFKAKIATEAIEEADRRQKVNQKVAALMEYQARLGESLRQSQQMQAKLGDQIAQINSHVGSIRSQQNGIQEEQLAMHRILSSPGLKFTGFPVPEGSFLSSILRKGY